MDKESIFKKLDDMQLDKEKVMIVSGASLVVHGVIDETDDIDLACEKSYYDALKWKTKTGAYGLEIKYHDVFEIGCDNLYFPNDVNIINGYKFLNLQKCLEMKKELNRSKDKNTIKILEKYITKK